MIRNRAFAAIVLGCFAAVVSLSTIVLVGVLQPLRANEKVEGKWFYRRSVALSNFHTACAMCHTNFGPVDATQWVGALMLRVPVADADE